MLNLSLLFLVTVFALLLWRRRRANRPSGPIFKPTPWDEFRRRVVQATGCQTVHEAVKQGHVTQLPGGWLEFDGLAHHADETATVADLWQARADHAAQQPAVETPMVGDFELGTAVWSDPADWEFYAVPEPADTNPGSDYVDAAPEPDTRGRFQPGDWVLCEGAARQVYAVCDYSPFVGWVAFAEGDTWRNPDHCTQLRKAGEFKVGDVATIDGVSEDSKCHNFTVTEVRSNTVHWEPSLAWHKTHVGLILVKPVELTSPWVGRSVHVGDGVGAKCVWAGDDLVLANGETVPAASAELHWDDVRVGDTAYWIHRDKSYPVIRARWKDEHRAEVVDDGYTHVPLYSMCRFTPANVTA